MCPDCTFSEVIIMNEALRELFPSLNKFTAYLNTASIGLMPLSSVRSLSNIVSDILEFNGPVNSVDYMDDLVLNPVLNEISKLIHASKDEVTISVQTTDALKRVLYAIKPERNKDNIVSVDMEFPTISCLLKSYSRSHELKLRIAKNIDGRYPIEALEQKIDDRTFAVVVSSVQWVTGYMIDIKELSKIAHEHGALIIVDAVQHVGAVDLDVRKNEVDVLAAGGEKWLLNPSVGSGILYVSRELLEKLEPYLGLLNMRPPPGTWTPWWADPKKDPWGDLEPRKDARILDFGGGMPYLLAAALLGSLRLLNNVGMKNITRHNLRLKRILVDAILEEDLKIIGYSDDEKLWSPITTIQTGLSFEKEKVIWEKLSEKRISVSHRGLLGIHGIRVSPHLYNTREEIEVFLEEFLRALGRVT